MALVVTDLGVTSYAPTTLMVLLKLELVVVMAVAPTENEPTFKVPELLSAGLLAPSVKLPLVVEPSVTVTCAPLTLA